MPLEEMTIDGWRDATRSADCCGELTVTKRVVANAATRFIPAGLGLCDSVRLGSDGAGV